MNNIKEKLEIIIVLLYWFLIIVCICSIVLLVEYIRITMLE